MPKAIRSVIFRIAVFYLGSILVLAMLLPWSSYSGKESPFVTALSSFHVPGLAGIMNFVVLTAALSGVNATLYAGSRLLRDLAANGTAPKATAAISRRGVPVGSLLSIGGIYLICLLLILFAGASDAFEIILGACAVFVLFGWVSIFVAHLGFRREVAAGRIPPSSFRMPGAPATDWICLAALALVFVSLIFNFSDPHWYYNLIAAVVLVGVHLLSYEYFSRKRVREGLPDVEPGHGPYS
jgi:L-asparagine permease